MKGSLGPKTSGHEVDFTTYTNDGDSYTPWITKLNKHEGEQGVDASILEVAFSEVALLFIKPGLTPPARIVVDEQNDNSVTGVASENFNVQIKKQLDQGQKGYAFSNDWEYTPIKTEISQADIDAERDKMNADGSVSDKAIEARLQLKEAGKGVRFLDGLPAGFFADLLQKHNEREIHIDMESLASVLASSYFLEEDDLHKGNIGFYVTEDAKGVKNFTFFKIDHDLMLTDSIMSQKDMRLANIFYNDDSFKISTRDLDGFPDLKDSGNHYWPTEKRILVAGSKAYTSKEEREAFINLKHDPEFIKAKWQSFLKCSIVPLDLVEKSLVSHLDPNDDKEKINMVRNSIWERVGELKARMLESEQFKQYLATDGPEMFNAIKEEVVTYLEQSGIAKEQQDEILAQMVEGYTNIFECANTEDITPFKKAVLLDCYRFSSDGKSHYKPSDDEVFWMKEKLERANQKQDEKNSYKYACVVTDMASTSDKKIDISQALAIKQAYLKPESIKTLKDFEAAADKIRATNLPLKQQKNEIIALLKQAKGNMAEPELKALKQQLQQKMPDSPSLKFVNQLRSEMWLVRKIRGTYGKTATASMMIKEIDSQLSKNYAASAKSIKNQITEGRIQDEKTKQPANTEEVKVSPKR
ncbi:hypothetical protein ACFORL_03015 [Legionella dresdenensis]|uniref:Dot/Icm T4SS effector n=1 Tax=Legionella dresdenensis TaxID=450200 RepID=A0ABV8CCK8_9GAMM